MTSNLQFAVVCESEVLGEVFHQHLGYCSKTKNKYMYQLILTSICTLLLGIECLAQTKIAIIKDKEGYAYIQSSKNTDFDIVGEIKSDAFFYCDKLVGDYYPVVARQWSEINEHYGNQLKGFLHKSHVQIVEALPAAEQKRIVGNALREYRNIIDPNQRNDSKSTVDSSKENSYPLEVSFFYEVKYEQILGFFADYYCKTKDTETLGLLFSTMWSNNNTASEIPAMVVCESYLCNEQLYLSEFHKIKDHAKLDYIKGNTNWGLLRHFDIDPESKNITNKEYLRLSEQLEK